MIQLQNDELRKDILKSVSPLLIMGGPGSGKTTIALFKAKQLIEEIGTLKKSQKVLFLSFARATISRVEEQAGDLIPEDTKQQIEINTYHGFIWNILKHHGYLLNSHPIHLLLPHEAGWLLSDVPLNKRAAKMHELFLAEGLVHFDMFAKLCSQLLTESKALRKLICAMYPVIILDEFQDTNMDEWNLIKIFGSESKLIALADPEQRIYDFRGADPKRISQFIETIHPKIFDFGQQNNRSSRKDIAQFGNDLLQQTNKGKFYNDVSVVAYPFYKKPFTHIYLKSFLLQIRKKLYESQGNDWSLAILVPTNSLMLAVSDTLQRTQKLSNGKVLPAIEHDVAVDTSGAYLAAQFIANLLENGSQKICTETTVLRFLIEHILGRKGANNSVSKADKETASALEQYIKFKKIRGKNRELLIAETKQLVNSVNDLHFSGNVVNDWKQILSIIIDCKSDYYKKVANDAKYLRLLQRGTQLYSALDTIWRNSSTYNGAIQAVSDALTQEHFSLSTKRWNGISVMTIHKSKGKEFDVVIVYEGRYHNKIVSSPERKEQAILNLRVAVTRAKEHTYILTPDDEPCLLL